MVLMDGNDNAAVPKVLPRATSKVVKKAKIVASSKSKLDPRVADFMRRIFDDKMMEESLKKQNIDIAKMPLGSLSRQQVAKGYEILCDIQAVLAAEKAPEAGASAAGTSGGGGVIDLSEAPEGAPADGDDDIAKERWRTRIKALSQQFYTTIPHVFPEGSPPAYIDNGGAPRDRWRVQSSLAG